jgi:molecular chaperone GrpE
MSKPRSKHAHDPDADAGGSAARSDAADAGDARADAGGAPDGLAAATAPSLEDQVVELHDRWLRTRAEMENLRRSLRQEADTARRYGAAPVLAALLEVLDNLQRALASPPANVDPGFLQGVQLIEQQFRSVLESHGVAPVPAEKGQAPDPNLHRILMEQPSADVAPGTILMTVVPGYRLHDRLLREAQVVVARAPD